MSCISCKSKIKREDDKLTCAGHCKDVFHSYCININETKWVEMRDTGYLTRWTCNDCTQKCTVTPTLADARKFEQT